MSLSEHQVRILETIAKIAPNAILRKYKETCCIAGARIIIEVLKKLHFKNIKPFTVEANIFNEVYVKKGRTPQSDEEAQQWLTEGCWQIVLGDREEKIEGRWPGHLVVLINDQYLLDVTIFQATRPHKGIHLTPVLTTVPEDFIKGEDKCGLMYNNCMIIYTSYPTDDSYKTARDWWDVARSKEVVSDILSEVKLILAKKK